MKTRLIIPRTKAALLTLRDHPLPPPRPSKEARRLARLHAEVLDAVRIVISEHHTLADHGEAVAKLRSLLAELDA